MLMLVLPEGDREGRGRCSVYRAALGQRASMVTLACNAVTALAASAETSPEAALGWLAVLAADGAFVPLANHPRPERLEPSVDTAHCGTAGQSSSSCWGSRHRGWPCRRRSMTMQSILATVPTARVR